MATFGFIGTGNMGGALARAARKRLSGGEILLANRSATKAEALAQELDCRAVDNAAVAAGADYIFLGVKPYMVAGLMEKIGPVLAARKDRPGKHIWLFGGGELASDFIRADAVDRYIVGILPVIRGKGRRLFQEGIPPVELHLDRCTVSDGIPILEYSRRGR